METKSEIIVDATNLILGRMATVVAKHLLEGKSITVLNSEKTVISGKRVSKVQAAKEKLEIGHPRKGPFWPRQPDTYVKRTVRGMLPRKSARGKEAYKRLRVYIGVPPEFKDTPFTTISEANAEKLKCPTITVGELVKEIGWHPVGE